MKSVNYPYLLGRAEQTLREIRMIIPSDREARLRPGGLPALLARIDDLARECLASIDQHEDRTGDET